MRGGIRQRQQLLLDGFMVYGCRGGNMVGGFGNASSSC